ncbi:hypothetical protein, partial [Nocardioides immobilis]|uniref:hypothetical protein n=1 Tax=Nocardioides immobilis TaxID=2049295 RepID=UPI001C712984
DRRGLLLRGVTPRLRLPGHLLLRHSSILVSKVRSLQETQGDSVRHAVRDRRRHPDHAQFLFELDDDLIEREHNAYRLGQDSQRIKPVH